MTKLAVLAATLAAPLAIAAVAAPAAAQTAETRPFTGYGSLGYSHSDRGQSDLGGVTGRVGLRFGRYLGAEAEGTFGVTDDDRVRGGRATETEWKRSVGAYAVGFVPLGDRMDVFARVGLANTKVETTPGVAGQSLTRQRNDSINYGAGVQYFLTQKDGLRADFTHESYRHGPGQASTYGVSYVRRF